MLRYYVRVSGKIIWADRPEDLVQHLPPPETLPPGVDPPRPISVTFIPASVFDNPALLRVNPEYLAWLLSLREFIQAMIEAELEAVLSRPR